MIVKIKTFSGENLYLSEEDYLDEVMYSDKMSTSEKVGLGVAGTGALVGAGLYGNRLNVGRKVWKSQGPDVYEKLKFKDKFKYANKTAKELDKYALKDMKTITDAEGKKIVGKNYLKLAKLGKYGAPIAAGIGAAGLAGYGISRYNRKNK